jgi:hypothetical protein
MCVDIAMPGNLPELEAAQIQMEKGDPFLFSY